MSDSNLGSNINNNINNNTDSNLIVTTSASGVVTVKLNREHKQNAFDDQLIIELMGAFKKIAADPAARAVILCSEGKNFSAGADLAWMKQVAAYSHEENLLDAAGLAQMLKALNDIPVPTIARVQGAAFGGAVGLVACCDMAVAAERASFCLSEVKIGLIPATISPYVINAIGQRAARRYFVTAERFTANTAANLGLVAEVVADTDLDTYIDQLVSHILNNGPQAVRAAKKLINDVAGRPIDKALLVETGERIAERRAAAEGQEGLSAFLEKRQPQWVSQTAGPATRKD